MFGRQKPKTPDYVVVQPQENEVHARVTANDFESAIGAQTVRARGLLGFVSTKPGEGQKATEKRVEAAKQAGRITEEDVAKHSETKKRGWFR